MRCSFLPGADTVIERLPDFTVGDPLSLDGGAILERGRPYLIELNERLALPSDISGRANPKSSTGRLDIFTRIITDGGSTFDDIAPGYNGPLFLEVVPRSFTVKVQTGLALNQLRLNNRGAPTLLDNRLGKLHSTHGLLFNGRARVRDPHFSGGLFLSLDLVSRRSRPYVGWRAKRNSALLDMTQVGTHDPDEFWEPVRSEPRGGLILEPEEFYLLLSKEGVQIPPDVASEMTAFDPTSGELRTHYAGFFDPGFGLSDDGLGSKAALEVRAHDVPFKVEDGQRICKLVFHDMAAPPQGLYGTNGSNYQFQNQTLSKHFQREAQRAVMSARRFTIDGDDQLPM